MNIPALIVLCILLALAIILYIYERRLAYKIANEEYIGEIVIDIEEDGEPTVYFVAAYDIETLMGKRNGRVAIIKYHTQTK